MASELNIQSSLIAAKSNVRVAPSTIAKTTNMATSGFGSPDRPAKYMHQTAQDVATSEEEASLGSVDITNATGGEYWLRLFNTDTTNYVDVFVKSAATPAYTQIGRIRPGETWGPARMAKLDGSGLGGVYLKANSATCTVEIIAVEAGVPTA